MTVGDLRVAIAKDVHLPNKTIGPEDFTLAFQGAPLSNSKDSTDLLMNHDIEDKSEILALLRVSGGEYQTSQERKIDRSIPMTNEECIISLDDTDPTIKLPCGHAIAPASLAEYVETEIKKSKTEIRCPVCKTEIKLSRVKKMGLTDVEIKALESGLAKNFLLSDPAKYKQCPQCKLFIEKKDEGVRIKCPYCSNFEFCWSCLRKWKASGSGYRDCGNTDCGKNSSFIQVLLTRKTTTMEYSNLVVPDTRACIKCGEGINHKEGCKHMTCPSCKEEFCFVCLKKWPCASGHAVWGQQCQVAPRQTKLPGK